MSCRALTLLACLLSVGCARTRADNYLARATHGTCEVDLGAYGVDDRHGLPVLSVSLPGPQGEDVVKLNTNENPWLCSPEVHDILREIDVMDLAKYPDPLCVDVRKVIAEKHEVGIGNVFAGNGSTFRWRTSRALPTGRTLSRLRPSRASRASAPSRHGSIRKNALASPQAISHPKRENRRRKNRS